MSVCLFLPVPLKSFVVKPVEKVRLSTDRSHVRMDAEKLQQCAGSAFLHADYNRLGKLLGPERVGHGDAVILRAVRHKRLLPRCVRGGCAW